MLVSGTQQSDSIRHILVSILFQILLLSGLLQNIEQTSPRSTVGLCWLLILYIAPCPRQSQSPNLPLLPDPSSLVTINLFSKSENLFLFCK